MFGEGGDENYGDRHEEDREFLRQLKKVTDHELTVILRWQACETWKRIAIEREQVRRTVEMMKRKPKATPHGRGPKAKRKGP